ncbi:uncharacterized protein AMSG_00506 [Thecamonas trahens ATCC 50062]|uniref:Uncharacterized protein n=1 Tax=Thecamonas trahens ATCC 50062 TaxID=461836 RepID=A0A0L0D9J3_THETB|nr:hypothetical protein AMSG_00506 [Thecamonas trahens ATCC 50062]KNC48731.1 hypothetical protein AMSG_00506 [Thecamonas trahens ATCC 50062]|eukprot:XP_013762783.1 hypothetical protein AMSG_00506 [Thecamonas trahens ATCC 50062]
MTTIGRPHSQTLLVCGVVVAATATLAAALLRLWPQAKAAAPHPLARLLANPLLIRAASAALPLALAALFLALTLAIFRPLPDAAGVATVAELAYLIIIAGLAIALAALMAAGASGVMAIVLARAFLEPFDAVLALPPPLAGRETELPLPPDALPPLPPLWRVVAGSTGSKQWQNACLLRVYRALARRPDVRDAAVQIHPLMTVPRWLALQVFARAGPSVYLAFTGLGLLAWLFVAARGEWDPVTSWYWILPLHTGLAIATAVICRLAFVAMSELEARASEFWSTMLNTVFIPSLHLGLTLEACFTIASVHQWAGGWHPALGVVSIAIATAVWFALLPLTAVALMWCSIFTLTSPLRPGTAAALVISRSGSSVDDRGLITPIPPPSLPGTPIHGSLPPAPTSVRQRSPSVSLGQGGRLGHSLTRRAVFQAVLDIVGSPHVAFEVLERCERNPTGVSRSPRRHRGQLNDSQRSGSEPHQLWQRIPHGDSPPPRTLRRRTSGSHEMASTTAISRSGYDHSVIFSDEDFAKQLSSQLAALATGRRGSAADVSGVSSLPSSPAKNRSIDFTHKPAIRARRRMSIMETASRSSFAGGLSPVRNDGMTIPGSHSRTVSRSPGSPLSARSARSSSSASSSSIDSSRSSHGIISSNSGSKVNSSRSQNSLAPSGPSSVAASGSSPILHAPPDDNARLMSTAPASAIFSRTPTLPDISTGVSDDMLECSESSAHESLSIVVPPPDPAAQLPFSRQDTLTLISASSSSLDHVGNRSNPGGLAPGSSDPADIGLFSRGQSRRASDDSGRVIGSAESETELSDELACSPSTGLLPIAPPDTTPMGLFSRGQSRRGSE